MTTIQTPELPSPPFFSVPNINNLRDAALFPGSLSTTNPPGQTRPGILFRSAEVSKLDRSGWSSLKQIGIGHVFDLRSKPEVDKGWKGVTGETDIDDGGKDVRPGWLNDMESVGIERDWVPVFAESDYSPERLAERYLKYMGESVEGFVAAYQDILQHAGPSFRTILLYLANLPPPGPNEGTGSKGKELGALIHCTAGKDRTGIFFGLIFSFLGVPASRIAEEYNLTELGLSHIRDEIVGRLMQSPGFKKYTLAQMAGKDLKSSDLADVVGKEGGGEGGGAAETDIPPEIIEKGRQAALRMISAKKESMVDALKMIEREWGSAEGYMRKECGLGDEEVEKLRRNLVVGA